MTADQWARERAGSALRAIETLPGQNDVKKRYNAYVKSLPATVRRIGLGQTLAVLLSRSGEKTSEEKAYAALYKHLEKWLCGDTIVAPYRNESDLMKAVINSDQATYVRAQTESLLYINWLKKFANAFLPRGEEGDE
jgi:CRISPR-associated protein Cmr5